ncbi:hypothetical protein [Flavobacterium sp.]|uniref:hypothetical protein n=1 Tax=Flavobacterium sp. TaxID=239 RepID=UPI00286DAB01|nr:hypothetical protein [Flavobacterium sp.]
MEKYRIHKLKKGDTVDSVAVELGITPFEVRGFHNSCCNWNDTIGHNFPTHITELLVYPHIRKFRKELHPMTTFESGYTLRAKPTDKKVNYNVNYNIITEDSITNTISCKISLECKQKSNGYFVYEINKSEIFINDEEPNYMLDELAEKVTQNIYPLQIVVNEEGKYIGIHNFNEIKKRWEKSKKEILEYHSGNWVNDYLELTDKTLENESSLQISLESDWFLSSFFGGIYINYTPFLKFENSITFPILPKIKPLVYKVEQTTDEYLDEFNQVIVEQNGILNEERSKADIENGLPFPNYSFSNPQAVKAQGTFTSRYFINSKNNTIESLFLQCSVLLDKPKKIEVIVALTN